MKPVKFNPFLERLSGGFGDFVFRRIGDRVFIVHKPDLHGIERTPAQLAQQERFRQATQYGHRALADPQAAAPYRRAAARSGRRAFPLAVSDYLLAPVVESIDLSAYTGRPGDPLRVLARDDFEVVSVHLRLLDAAGMEIEQGPALRDPQARECWLYTARGDVAPGTRVCVEAVAADRPGNRTTLAVEQTV